jgi:2,4-dienoyl-CoA reductase-like NADH-dependent reductase (Old Yellow Enzyme family)/thioredoxin reductase
MFMNFEAAFTPMYIGKMLVKNRLVVPAMDSGMFEEDGSTGDLACDYYARRAEGGFGMIIIEIAAVDRRGIGQPHQLRVYDDVYLPGLSKLADSIKAGGARAVVQLHHAGRETMAVMAGAPPIAPSAVPCPTCRETPEEFTTEEVYALIRSYVDCSVRVQKAGFDGVEIHSAHGYMGGQFLSPRANKRIDEFGGGVYGRTVFLKLVIEGIKAACGEGFPVIIRLSTDETRIGGVEPGEAVVQAQLLEEHGADAIHVSAGTYGSWETIVPPPDYPSAWNIEATARVKNAVSIPVIAVGRYNDPYIANLAISRGDTDFVALGRQSIADPFFPNKMLAGQLKDIVPCIGCTPRCMGANDPENLQPGDMGVSCMLNPMSIYRPDVRIVPAQRQKKIVVIGAGPAGMEAAWIAAKRGHDVTLFEKSSRAGAGGQFRIAAYPPFKQELTRAIQFLLYKCEKHGVDMRFDTEATVETVKSLKPDAVIVATGGTPLIPDIPGISDADIVTAQEILLGNPVLKNSALVIGGGLVGVETAEYCTDYCNKVTIVEMLPEIAESLYLTVRNSLLARFKKEEIDVRKGAKVLKLIKGGAICEQGGERITLDGYDTVILALGAKAYQPFTDASSLADEVHIIGDAKKARSALEAIYEAARVALKI